MAKTDGVPLFVEELTKAVLESGLLADEGDRYELAGPLPPLAIPATLQDSLMARLDRLAPVKEVAQIGAAIGREFSHELLAAVAPRAGARTAGRAWTSSSTPSWSSAAARRPTARPTPSSTRWCRTRPTRACCSSKRQQLHARIAQRARGALSGDGRDRARAARAPLRERRAIEKAVDYWLRAGQRAMSARRQPRRSHSCTWDCNCWQAFCPARSGTGKSFCCNLLCLASWWG